jgi:hypothetical protein
VGSVTPAQVILARHPAMDKSVHRRWDSGFLPRDPAKRTN